MGKLKIGDRVLIVVAVVACVAAGAWFLLGKAPGATGGDASDLLVVCQTTGGFYRVDPLASDTEYTVTSDAGPEQGTNTIRIADGTVDVISADCSNQICVEHDPISQPGEQIVCLPHGLVVEVVADEADATALVEGP